VHESYTHKRAQLDLGYPGSDCAKGAYRVYSRSGSARRQRLMYLIGSLTRTRPTCTSPPKRASRRASRTRPRPHRPGRRRIILLALAVVGAAGATASLALHEYHWQPLRVNELSAMSPKATGGVLKFSIYGVEARMTTLTPHTSVFVNGRHYQGMEDNDIRGFLDGVGTHFWNQPTQTHVRIGRRGDNPRYGEHELFRVLHRWTGVTLPPETSVTRARLRFSIDRGCPVPLQVFLYAVNKDWDPGVGGVNRNNVSPPRKGEVLWRDIASEERPWGLPGAGFASDLDREADTGTMALAVTTCQPDETHLTFESEALTRYVNEHVGRAEPLLFLEKLADYEEDLPGAHFAQHSGNEGNGLDVSRRPQLILDWSGPSQIYSIERDVLLDFGRSTVLPRLELHGEEQFVSATFDTAPGFESPTIEIRGGDDESTAPWTSVSIPVAIPDWRWLEVRLIAATDPVALGEVFSADIRDTWILTGPPEAQDVWWTFVSPTGDAHRVKAEYADDYRWRVNFVPHEPGRWHYHWEHKFTEDGFRSKESCFDVIARNHDETVHELEAFLDRLRESGTWNVAGVRRTKLYGTIFNRLQRAALQFETQDTFQSERGRTLRHLLKQIREEIGGEPLNDLSAAHERSKDEG